MTTPFIVTAADKRLGHAIYLFNPKTLEVYHANQIFLNLLGYTLEEILAKKLTEFIATPPETIRANLDLLISSHHIDIWARQYQHKDGTLIDVEVSASHMVTDNQDLVIATVEDVRERHQSEARQRIAAKVFENMEDGILVTDGQGVIQFANPAMAVITGYSLEELIGMSPRLFYSGRHNEQFYQNIWHSLQTGGQWKGEVWNKRRNGTVTLDSLIINTISDPFSGITMYVGVYRDLTERLEREELIRFQANHDSLTGLPNRRFFQEYLQKIIQCNSAEPTYKAVLFLDLDGFKPINDTYGHETGDKLLQEVSKRLQACLASQDLVARLGGDEFIALICSASNRDGVKKATERIAAAIQKPYVIDGQLMTVSASIGISQYPMDGTDEKALMHYADLAMYQAKKSGKNRFYFYDSALNNEK